MTTDDTQTTETANQNEAATETTEKSPHASTGTGETAGADAAEQSSDAVNSENPTVTVLAAGFTTQASSISTISTISEQDTNSEKSQNATNADDEEKCDSNHLRTVLEDALRHFGKIEHFVEGELEQFWKMVQKKL